MIIRVIRHIEFNGQGMDFTAEAEIADDQAASTDFTKLGRELFDSTFKVGPTTLTSRPDNGKGN